MGAIDTAGAILSRAQERVEVAAQNMANMTTPGYKARVSFSHVIQSSENRRENSPTVNTKHAVFDTSNGVLRETGNAFDLAVIGNGFFVIRTGDAIYYTRNGQLSRNADGCLVTADGMILQSTDGDVSVSGGNIEVAADGTVLDGGQPVAQIRLAEFADGAGLTRHSGGAFSARPGDVRDVAAPQVRQGVLEASNVSTSSEMIEVMAALRTAESGQRMVQIYDDLMGRALTAFGQM